MGGNASESVGWDIYKREMKCFGMFWCFGVQADVGE